MSLFYAPRPYSEESRRQAVAELLENTVPDRDFYLLVVGAVVLAVVLAGFFSLFVKSYFAVADRVFISFFPNLFFDLTIAVVSGIIAAYGLVRVKVGTAMTGIGIAVSLMPPLVATGIGLFDPADNLALRAGSIFLLNVIGILAGSMLVYFSFGLHRERQAIESGLS